LHDAQGFANGATMIDAPETILVRTRRIACDGSGEDVPPALGHPKVWLEIDETGAVECGYCDRRFVLVGGPADNGKVKKKD
jgi:NADH dehydrogenase (ubiquinone) Fe-S protein 6